MTSTSKHDIAIAELERVRDYWSDEARIPRQSHAFYRQALVFALAAAEGLHAYLNSPSGDDDE